MVAALTPLAASEASDAVVIEASRRDPELFAVLYDRYAAQLYRYAQRRVGAATAEDAVADAFAAAFARRDRYKAMREDARPWLFGILTNVMGLHRRREEAQYRAWARTPDAVVGDSLADRVSAEVTARAVRGRLGAALAELSTGDRDVLLLVAWGDLSYIEVAHALRIPVGTVRSRLNRARRKVREVLGGVDPTTISEEGPWTT
jgi:RNA polymerase sigma-70 factor (ECF subfamily)